MPIGARWTVCSTTPDGDEDGSDGDVSVAHLAGLFDDLALDGGAARARPLRRLPGLLHGARRERVASPPTRATHRRVKILGLLEARLLTVDRVVLGGLDEGVWPPRTRDRRFPQPADAGPRRPRAAGAPHRTDGA